MEGTIREQLGRIQQAVGKQSFDLEDWSDSWHLIWQWDRLLEGAPQKGYDVPHGRGIKRTLAKIQLLFTMEVLSVG